MFLSFGEHFSTYHNDYIYIQYSRHMWVASHDSNENGWVILVNNEWIHGNIDAYERKQLGKEIYIHNCAQEKISQIRNKRKHCFFWFDSCAYFANRLLVETATLWNLQVLKKVYRDGWKIFHYAVDF